MGGGALQITYSLATLSHAAPHPSSLSRPRTSHPPSLAVKAERIRASSCKHTRGYKSTQPTTTPPQAPPALEADFPLPAGQHSLRPCSII